MEKEEKKVKKSYWLIILIIQTLGFIGVIIWAMTQKIEAERQKAHALIAKEEAINALKEASLAKKEFIQVKELSEQLKKENLNYKELYEKSLTSKK